MDSDTGTSPRTLRQRLSWELWPRCCSLSRQTESDGESLSQVTPEASHGSTDWELASLSFLCLLSVSSCLHPTDRVTLTQQSGRTLESGTNFFKGNDTARPDAKERPHLTVHWRTPLSTTTTTDHNWHWVELGVCLERVGRRQRDREREADRQHCTKCKQCPLVAIYGNGYALEYKFQDQSIYIKMCDL